MYVMPRENQIKQQQGLPHPLVQLLHNVDAWEEHAAKKRKLCFHRKELVCDWKYYLGCGMGYPHLGLPMCSAPAAAEEVVVRPGEDGEDVGQDGRWACQARGCGASEMAKGCTCWSSLSRRRCWAANQLSSLGLLLLLCGHVVLRSWTMTYESSPVLCMIYYYVIVTLVSLHCLLQKLKLSGADSPKC